MVATPYRIRAKIHLLREDLPRMSRDAVMGWGKRHFGGAEPFLSRMEHAPDGSPSDFVTECDALIAWAESLAEFGKIVRDMPKPPPRMVKLTTPRGF